MAISKDAAVAAAKPASEAEVLVRSTGPLQLTFTSGNPSAPDDDARMIRLLDVVLDELEQAGRLPGELVTITRQAKDSCVNDLAIVRRHLMLKMAER